MKLKTDFIRAAVAGKTPDGREITEQQITQMAQSYNTDTYMAHIWLEHLRSITADGVFKSLGDVITVKAERVKGGALDGKMALYVQLEPHPDLVTMVRNGQKVHLSIEMLERFPITNGAYLMGIGVTDSPASLGTGIMQFSISSRKGSVFSEPTECLVSESIKGFLVNNQPENFKQMFDFFTNEVNCIRGERDEWKAKYNTLLKEKNAEIYELKCQISANGYKSQPLFKGNEGRTFRF